MTQQQTILISSRPGLLARMQLRSPVFGRLRSSGATIVVLWPLINDRNIHDELGKAGVKIESLKMKVTPPHLIRRFSNLLIAMRQHVYPPQSNLVPPQKQRLHRQVETARHLSWRTRLYWQIIKYGVWVLERSAIVRTVAMAVESLIATTNLYSDLFDHYKPSVLVVGTAAYASWREEVYLLREARRAGIPTVYVVPSWDNPSTKGMMGAMPDYFLVWTEIMKKEFVEIHSVAPERIFVVGTPLVDAYVNNQSEENHQEIIHEYDLDPDRKIILFGTMAPSSYAYNVDIVQMLVRAVQNESFIEPVQLIVRVHPNSYKRSGTYELGTEHPMLTQIRELALSCPYTYLSEPQMLSRESMDLPWSEVERMVRLISGSDIVISLFSTMQIEAALADKPIINIAYDPVAPTRVRDHRLAEPEFYPHLARIINTGGTQLARSEDDLIRHINRYLRDPNADCVGRNKIVNQECGVLDGRAGERIADFILAVAKRDNLTAFRAKS